MMMTRRTRSGLGRFWKGRSHREGVESTVLPHEYQMLAHRGDPRAQEPETLRRPTHPCIPWHAIRARTRMGSCRAERTRNMGAAGLHMSTLAGKRCALDAPPRQAFSFHPSRSFGKAPRWNSQGPAQPPVRSTLLPSICCGRAVHEWTWKAVGLRRVGAHPKAAGGRRSPWSPSAGIGRLGDSGDAESLGGRPVPSSS